MVISVNCDRSNYVEDDLLLFMYLLTVIQFHIRINFIQGEVKSEVVKLGFTPPTSMTLEAFRILGLSNQPSDVKINNQPVEFHYNIESKVNI